MAIDEDRSRIDAAFSGMAEIPAAKPDFPADPFAPAQMPESGDGSGRAADGPGEPVQEQGIISYQMNQSAYGHGGRRPGAGRPKGAVAKKSRELMAYIEASEKQSPVEVMLDVMHDAARRDPDSRQMANPLLALDAAKNVAPYLHPRLSATLIREVSEGAGQHVTLDATAEWLRITLDENL